jgi:kinesin family member 22
MRPNELNFLYSFAVRTKNVENKPVVNERGKCTHQRLPSFISAHILYAATDNRPAPKPHFAALAIQPPPAKLAPAVVQAISTAGSGSGPSRPRISLVPVSRSHRMSSLGGGGNGYQAFGINGPRRGLGVNDKIVESEGSSSRGFAMTEKDIDERVCYFFF